MEINIYAAILTYRLDEVPSSQTQNVAKSLVFRKRKNAPSHMYLHDICKNFRTRRRKAPSKFIYLKVPYPKLKRGPQTANVTAIVWSRGSWRFAVTHIHKQTWI